jgi:hypothetical protein
MNVYSLAMMNVYNLARMNEYNLLYMILAGKCKERTSGALVYTLVGDPCTQDCDSTGPSSLDPAGQRDIFQISLWSSSLLTGSLAKLWISISLSSNSNMFFKIAKRLFKDHGEKGKFVYGPRGYFSCS